MTHIRIIGTPRSGTNYIKYLIETNSEYQCGFHVGWWKHSIIPSIMSGTEVMHDNTPTVIMFREPLEQIASFYKFAKLGRAAIQGKTDSFSSFIREPIIMRPSDKIEYWFDNPIAYWKQFYRAALSWNNTKMFLDLGVIRQHPAVAEKALSELMGKPFQLDHISSDLKKYMAPNIDKPVSSGWSFINDTSLKLEDEKNKAIMESVSDDDRSYILSDKVNYIYKSLKKTSIDKTACNL